MVAEWKEQHEDSMRREREWEREAMERGREANEQGREAIEQEREAMEREREKEDMPVIIAEDREDNLDQDAGEQYMKLRRGGIQKTTTGETTT